MIIARLLPVRNLKRDCASNDIMERRLTLLLLLHWRKEVTDDEVRVVEAISHADGTQTVTKTIEEIAEN